MPIKICKSCGKEYKARSKRSRYCDGPCFVANERAKVRQHRATFSPERKRAIILTQCAMVRGELKRQPCEQCGKSSRWHLVAHHDDYAKPLEIRWLCRSHHKMHHDRFGPGKNAFAVSPSN